MTNLKQLFLTGALLLFSPACSQKTELPSIFDNPAASPANAPNKNQNAKVDFKKLKLPSVDATFKELEKLDGRVVKTRNSLKKSRKSVRSLSNGDMKSLRREIARLMANGTLRVKKKNNLPTITYNKAKGNDRSLKVFQSVKKMEKTLRTAKSDFPKMKKDLQRLKKKSKKAIKKAPDEAQKAISNGKMKPKQLNNTMLKAKGNLKQVKRVPVHVDQLGEEIKLTTKMFRNLFRK